MSQGRISVYDLCVLGCGLAGLTDATRATHGFVEIIISDEEQQRILGIREAGPQVSSTIMSIAHFMNHGKGLNDVLKSVSPHPTITEGIAECLRMLQGESIFKPHPFPGYLQIRRWHPEMGMIDEKEMQ